MKNLALQLVDYLQGSFSLVFVLISLIIGLTILSKYSKYKSRLYILVGISWIGVANPWFPDSISFIMYIASGFQNGLDIGWYFIIGNCFIPIALLSWLTAFTDMISKKKQKLVITLTIAAVFDSLLGTIFEDPTDPLLAIMVVIVRVLLIISAIEFYGGFYCQDG